MKDSKKIHSHKKMTLLADYIKEHAIAWHIHYEEASVIDAINIRQAVLQAMKECAKQIMRKMNNKEKMDPTQHDNEYFLIIDGNDFPGYTTFDEKTESFRHIPHITVEQGDNSYTSIAAASIIAKHARDQYILDLCEEHPELKEKYLLHKNMGYGTKAHMDGIKQWGITEWHRRSFGICKNA
jgi:ribonuclease HII